MSKLDLKAKEAQAIAARERFMATLHELQTRLSPKAIASDVKATVKEKADGAMSAAKDGVIQAATHPSTVAAITIPVLVYLFRKPLASGLNALLRREPDAPSDVEPYEAARAPVHDEQNAARPSAVRETKYTEQGA